MISLRQGSSLVTTSLRFTRQSHGISQNISTTSYAGASQQNDGNWSSPVPVEEVRRFVVDSMVKVGTIEDHATALADVLVAADYRGHYSHGLNRLEMYIQDASSGICESNAEPEIINSKFATAFVDGKNSLGPVVGNFCMKLAIEKAKQFGVGWVAANNSNHYGIAGWYSMQAANEGLMGLSFTNTSPFLQPTRAKGSALGTNPITLAAPGLDGDQFVLDMATTAVALGKLEIQSRKNEPIPAGWASDKEGKVTTNASDGMQGCLMPLGGAENTSGYKGFGLATMVEIFCGVLAGASYGPNIRNWLNTRTKANLGQCFIAVDPGCFAPGFEARLSDLMTHFRQMEPTDPGLPVMVAGDPERKHMAQVDAEGGIRYHNNHIKSLAEFARAHQIEEMKHV